MERNWLQPGVLCRDEKGNGPYLVMSVEEYKVGEEYENVVVVGEGPRVEFLHEESLEMERPDEITEFEYMNLEEAAVWFETRGPE